MAEKPILFNDASVRAIIEGRKSQTRRIIKPPRRKVAVWDGADTWNVDPGGTQLFGPGPYVKMPFWHVDDPYNGGNRQMERVRCPYGYPEYGDKLWVREAHMLECQVDAASVNLPPFDDGRPIQHDPEWGWTQPHYRATDPVMPYLVRPEVDDDRPMGWRPSIHMPRWACRLELRITRVRVERLRDISEADALAEGAKGSFPLSNTMRFAAAWDEINDKRAPWMSDPWVWVLDFEVDR